ncbi:hypothetical protein Avbf_02710 [Armadillidium vulgare]|nr:hypothetical protein Avbf_02710 [Armadillidium vulgare]
MEAKRILNSDILDTDTPKSIPSPISSYLKPAMGKECYFCISNTVNETFIINITHLDEIPPYLQVKALRVQQGTRKNITRYEIQARDPDTSDEFLMFMVREAPKYGKIQVITEEGDLIETKTFTMHDISEEKLSYLHNGDSLKEDLFTITVSDPYNKGYLFLENEEPTLESSPVVAQNTITSFDLNIKDEDSTPEQLVYKITQDPKYGVIRLKTHTRPVSSFTQASYPNVIS